MQLLDSLPLWAVYLLIVVIAILVVEGGFYLGRYWAAHGRGAKDGQVKQQNVGALVGSSLALLAFLLVFMTGIASTRFDTRRQLVIAEANAIGTTYLRTSFLDEPERTAMRDLLREYVDLRLDTAAHQACFTRLGKHFDAFQGIRGRFRHHSGNSTAYHPLGVILLLLMLIDST